MNPVSIKSFLIIISSVRCNYSSSASHKMQEDLASYTDETLMSENLFSSQRV